MAFGDASNDDTVDLRVKIGNQALAGELAARLMDVQVTRTLGVPAKLRLRLAAWDSDSEELAWVDDAQFAPGGMVEVELGHLDRLEQVFHGDIVSLDFEASTTDRAILTVHAYDVLHRLGRGQRTALHTKKNYAGIARTIAEEGYQLQIEADDDQSRDPERASVHQENISDRDFLHRLAREIGYDLFARGPKLVFRKSREGRAPELTLDAARDLIQFNAHLAAAGQLGGVDVVTLQTDTKERIEIPADNPDSTDKAYGSSPTRVVLVQEPYTTSEQAKARARAALTEMRSRYLQAEATCFGQPELMPGMIVQLDKLGKRFGGVYCVTTVTHSLSATGGLRSSVQLRGEPR